MLIYTLHDEHFMLEGCPVIVKEWIEFKTEDEMRAQFAEYAAHHPRPDTRTPEQKATDLDAHFRTQTLARHLERYGGVEVRTGQGETMRLIPAADILVALPDLDPETVYEAGCLWSVEAPEGMDREVFNAEAARRGWRPLAEPRPFDPDDADAVIACAWPRHTK